MLNAHRHPSRARDFPRRWRKRIGIAEDTHRFWDLVIKVLGIAALIGSGWWALYKYREDRHAEVNSVIFQKQAEIYFETATVAGTIAYAKDDQELKAAKENSTSCSSTV
jgi:hypothetical protein